MRANFGGEENSPRCSMETKIIKTLIISYFDIVRKNLNDVVPKTVMAFLVNKSKNQCQRELVSQLYNEGKIDFEHLLQEEPAQARKREVCKDMVVSLKESLHFLNEIRDFHFDQKAEVQN